ncbi:hypothetical protein C1H46_032755 [Malus baccata]|uniref:Uncharacterized protein n=1 Tax=Malus baccata TaxID=106549 RepID=A0A540L5P0_MALBA|nr:hypothetical protein C1H46_032755 [Malus baccata]
MGKGGQSINGVAKEAKPFEQENMAAWLVDVNTTKILPFELPSIGIYLSPCPTTIKMVLGMLNRTT